MATLQAAWAYAQFVYANRMPVLLSTIRAAGQW